MKKNKKIILIAAGAAIILVTVFIAITLSGTKNSTAEEQITDGLPSAIPPETLSRITNLEPFQNIVGKIIAKNGNKITIELPLINPAAGESVQTGAKTLPLEIEIRNNDSIVINHFVKSADGFNVLQIDSGGVNDLEIGNSVLIKTFEKGLAIYVTKTNK